MPTEYLTQKEKAELVKVIKEKAYKQSGNFKLASGGTSSFFFDMKKVTLDPVGSKLITKAMKALVYKENVMYVGGMMCGAIPIVSELCIESDPNKPIYGFFVRKSNDGRNPQIEGNLKEGEKVLLVDDVTTMGGSVLNAVKAVKDLGCKVEKVITIVDRLQGAKENLAKEGIELIALTTKNDF